MLADLVQSGWVVDKAGVRPIPSRAALQVGVLLRLEPLLEHVEAVVALAEGGGAGVCQRRGLDPELLRERGQLGAHLGFGLIVALRHRSSTSYQIN